MSKENEENNREIEFGIRAFACIEVPDPFDEFPSNGCNTDDDNGCGECKRCPCDDSPSATGNPQNFAGNPASGLVDRFTSFTPQRWPRLGGDYKGVGLFNGNAEDGRTFSIGDPTAFGFAAQLAWTNRSLSNGVLRPIDAGWGVSWFFNLTDAEKVSQTLKRCQQTLKRCQGPFW